MVFGISFNNSPLVRASINTATLGHRLPIREMIDMVARHGFGAIAPWRRDIDGEDVRVVARQIREAGLTVSSYCRSTYFPAPTREERLANIADNIEALRTAAELGAACFVLVVGGLPEGSRDLAAARSQVVDGIAALLDEARQLATPLALEPLHPMYAADRSSVNTLAQALDICEVLEPEGMQALGVALDVYHVWWDPQIAQGIARAGSAGRLVAFHLSDWRVPTRDLLMDRAMIGDGVIDLPLFVKAVADAGYRGHAEVEIFSNEIWQWPPDEVLAICAERLTGLLSAL